jgi:single-strand DNA-binding protein
MAGTVNKVILIGRLGRDPELKYTPSGAPVAKFSLATDESYKDRSGEQKDRTEWHNIVAWNKLAEICGQYLTKGKLVYIEGKIQSREWEDKQTHDKRKAYEIVALRMQMLGSRADSERAAGAATAPSAASPEPAAAEPSLPEAPPASSEITDEDVPF